MSVDLSKRSPYLHKKLSKRLWRLQKAIYHRLQSHTFNSRTILFIVGCQRSGTTLMQRILERDWRTKIYPETNSAVTDPTHRGKLRLRPLSEVAAILENDRAPIVILKPLVESQNTPELLHHFDGAKALWMYRDYHAVISSKMRKAGDKSAIGDLRYLAQNVQDDWRVEKVPADVRDFILDHFDEKMSVHDAGALYWYLRNQFFFAHKLDRRADVRLCRYDHVVQSSETAVRRVYDFAGQPYPGDHVLADIHAQSVGNGAGIALHPEIEARCRHLLTRLDRAFAHTT